MLEYEVFGVTMKVSPEEKENFFENIFLNSIETGVFPAPPDTILPTQITGILIFFSDLNCLYI